MKTRNSNWDGKVFSKKYISHPQVQRQDKTILPKRFKKRVPKKYNRVDRMRRKIHSQFLYTMWKRGKNIFPTGLFDILDYKLKI